MNISIHLTNEQTKAIEAILDPHEEIDEALTEEDVKEFIESLIDTAIENSAGRY